MITITIPAWVIYVIAIYCLLNMSLDVIKIILKVNIFILKRRLKRAEKEIDLKNRERGF